MNPKIPNLQLTQMQPLQKWERYFADASNASLVHQLRGSYGDDAVLCAQQRTRYAQLLAQFGQIYGDAESIVIARAPGRVNLVGMHIDHQGGAVNPIAIKETRVVAQPRSDDLIVLANSDRQFESRRFRVSEITPRHSVDWSSWTRELSAQRQAAGVSVDWSDYVKAAIIALQERERGTDGGYVQKLCGMNLLVDSNLPTAAGLSSSSALVVASAYAVIACNRLSSAGASPSHDAPKILIELLGEAEWYVGVRGGMGDHAVIILGRCRQLSHIQLSPIHVEYAPFPADYRIVVCHCGVEAKKSAGAKNIYNERVAGYAIGLLMLKRKYPQIVNRVGHFRDLYPEYLGISTAQLYEMLKTLPIRATRAEIAGWLPEHRETLEALYQSHHAEPGGYRLRGVCLYGIAECERSRKALDFLRQREIHRFGQLIDLSHEGDRVSVNGGMPFEPDMSEAYLDTLIRLAGHSDPDEREKAALYRQPGAYATSCRELDELVDLVRRVRGVYGAGLIGAGLGGCISMLVQTDAVAKLIQTLHSRYYIPHGLEPFIEVCTPVAGASVLRLEE